MSVNYEERDAMYKILATGGPWRFACLTSEPDGSHLAAFVSANGETTIAVQGEWTVRTNGAQNTGQ